MTNIKNSFEYQSEQAKLSFQGNITALMEVSGLIKSKIDTAIRNGKAGIFFPTADAEILYEWIQKSTVTIYAEYQIIDRVNRKAMKLYQCAQKIEQHNRCTCKHLIASDKFLVEWEKYKMVKQKAA